MKNYRLFCSLCGKTLKTKATTVPEWYTETTAVKVFTHHYCLDCRTHGTGNSPNPVARAEAWDLP